MYVEYFIHMFIGQNKLAYGRNLDRYITENIGNFSSKCFKVTYIRCFSGMLLKAAVLQNILKKSLVPNMSKYLLKYIYIYISC